MYSVVCFCLWTRNIYGLACGFGCCDWCFDVTDTLLHAHTYGNVDIDSGWHSVALNPACTYKQNEAIRSPNLHIVPKGLSGWRHRRPISAGRMRPAVTEAPQLDSGILHLLFSFFAVFHIQYSSAVSELVLYHSLPISYTYVSLFFSFSPSCLSPAFLSLRPAAMSAPGPSSSDVLKKAFPHVDIDGHNLPPSPAPSSPRSGKKYAIATELVYTESNDQYNASSVPIYQV